MHRIQGKIQNSLVMELKPESGALLKRMRQANRPMTRIQESLGKIPRNPESPGSLGSPEIPENQANQGNRGNQRSQGSQRNLRIQRSRVNLKLSKSFKDVLILNFSTSKRHMISVWVA